MLTLARSWNMKAPGAVKPSSPKGGCGPWGSAAISPSSLINTSCSPRNSRVFAGLLGQCEHHSPLHSSSQLSIVHPGLFRTSCKSHETSVSAVCNVVWMLPSTAKLPARQAAVACRHGHLRS